MFNIILQADTYHDYNRDEYYHGEVHVIGGVDLESCLNEAKNYINDKCKNRFLDNSNENDYEYMCAVNGVFVGGDANIIYPSLNDDQVDYIEQMESEAQSILNTIRDYDAERTAFWKEQKNIKVRADNELRLEQQRIKEKAELKRLQEKYGKQ